MSGIRLAGLAVAATLLAYEELAKREVLSGDEEIVAAGHSVGEIAAFASTTLMNALGIVGVALSVLVVDRFGIGPGGRRPVALSRVLAAGLAIVGVAITVSGSLGEGGLAVLPVVLAVLVVVGVLGKSAQLPFQDWLADAMAGPTPVSALIHAATMVTAGVFMVCRLSPMFETSPTALAVVTAPDGILGVLSTVHVVDDLDAALAIAARHG